jgi:competence protein ComEC
VADTQTLFLPVSAGAGALSLALVGVGLVLLPMCGRYRLLALMLMLPLVVPGRAPDTAPRLSVLDAGQGTAVVFTAGDRALLYDTGGGDPAGPNIANSVVLPWLQAAGWRSLETLIISHHDLDHSAGTHDVLRALPVANFMAGETPQPGARACRAGMAWRWPGGITFQVLSPAAPQQGNDGSCVVLIETPDMRVLLAGDIGVDQERELIRFWGARLKSDVLLVGHHGSATSTSQSWLNYVSPRVAVVSAGYASQFGHPHAQVMQRLEAQGVEVRETAHEGALTLDVGAAGALQVSAHRSAYHPWWM